MNTALTVGVLNVVRTGLLYLIARQNNDDDFTAIDVISSVDLRPFGLDVETLDLVNYTKTGLAFLARRGIPIEESLKVIETAVEEERDVTEEEVQTLIDVARSELDETQAKIDEMSSDDDSETNSEE